MLVTNENRRFADAVACLQEGFVASFFYLQFLKDKVIILATTMTVDTYIRRIE